MTDLSSSEQYPLRGVQTRHPHSSTQRSPSSSAGTILAGSNPDRAPSDETADVAARQHSSSQDVPQRCLDVKPRNTVYTREEKEKAWSELAEMVERYSDRMVARWNQEIDTYRVFAGLFSAFSLQSYWLMLPSAPDPSIFYLAQISAQLATIPQNSSIPLQYDDDLPVFTPYVVPLWTVFLNILWFSGLILSLTSASAGFMVKQWLNEYNNGISGHSRLIARMRQYRLNNLEKWGVGLIVATIPIMLQLAVVLFLAGVLILLWVGNTLVACIISILVFIYGIFTVSTTIIPLYNHYCCYVTPLVHAIIYFCQKPVHTPSEKAAELRLRRVTVLPHPRTAASGSSRQDASADGVSIHARGTAQWVAPSLPVSPSPPSDVDDMSIPIKSKLSWKEQERCVVAEKAIELDLDILLKAYTSTLHPAAISAATMCLMDLPEDAVLRYFTRLHASARDHSGDASDWVNGPLARGNGHRFLWLHVLSCLISLAHKALSEKAPDAEGEMPLSQNEIEALAVYLCGGNRSSDSTPMADTPSEVAISAPYTLVEAGRPVESNKPYVERDISDSLGESLSQIAVKLSSVAKSGTTHVSEALECVRDCKRELDEMVILVYCRPESGPPLFPASDESAEETQTEPTTETVEDDTDDIAEPEP